MSHAHALGPFCFRVGFSIHGWRTNAVWLLAAVHAVGDLMFKITNLHGLVPFGGCAGRSLMWIYVRVAA